MKRTRTKIVLSDYPTELHPRLRGAEVYDSSSSPEARVLYLPGDGGCFLKTARAGTLLKESEMTRYFFERGLSAEVLYYGTEGGRDFLVTAALPGEDCTDARYLSEPKRLAVLLGERLRALHALPCADCPVKNRMGDYFALVRENYAKGQYNLSYLSEELSHFTAEEAYRYALEHESRFQNEVLLHGDYCLPNVLLDGWRFSGFIDVGNGGVGDRHVDVFWGAWTLRYNLKTDAYRELLLDAYGREAVDGELLAAVSACEVFG